MPAVKRLRHVAGTMWCTRRNHFRLPLGGAEHHIQQSSASKNVQQTRCTTPYPGIIWSWDQDVFQSPLLPESAVPVNPAASKEVVTHHALAKQKKDDCQDDYKHETSNSEPGWLSLRSPSDSN